MDSSRTVRSSGTPRRHQENHEVLLLWPDGDGDGDENRDDSDEFCLGDCGPSGAASAVAAAAGASGSQAFTLVLVRRCISHSYVRTSAIVIEIQSSIHANA